MEGKVYKCGILLYDMNKLPLGEKREQIAAYINRDMVLRVETFAKENNVSKSKAVEEIIRMWIDNV